MTCAVAHPCDRDSLLGALEAARRKLIVPILVGPAARIQAIAAANGADIAPYRLVNTAHSHASAATAVALARSGEVETLMKGSLHTDEIMAEVISAQTGLRTDRRISHVFVMDVPAYDRMLLVTDAAINIEPTLREKADIAQNAIDLARHLGVELPKVAILSAVETVNPDIRSTLDAAALCKMADRGQITGAVLDGPLAFDNAISEFAARTKSIKSPVAGAADVAAGAEHRGGQHARQAAALLRGRRQRRHRAWRAGAGRADEPRRQRAHADRFRRRRQVARARAPRSGRARGPAETMTVRAAGGRAILVLNAGSSSIKFCVFRLEAGAIARDLRGQISGLTAAPRIALRRGAETLVDAGLGRGPMAHAAALDHLLDALHRELRGTQFVGVGHRVVHGGLEFMAPIAVDAPVLARLDRYVPLAPLHQPHNLSAIREMLERLPGVPEIACFDTAFHRTVPEVAQLFALPPRFAEAGVRRYGFHGLSYEYIATQLPALDARAAAGRTVVFHLGNGCSMCALHGGQSVATTMGFTAVEGLPMGTRCGSLDPGVLLFLMDELRLGPREIERLIYHESGLLGMSGLSSDMRDLLASDDPAADARGAGVRLSRGSRTRLARRRARRAGCGRVHGRHRREPGRGAGAHLPRGRVARPRTGCAREPAARTDDQRAGECRACLRRADRRRGDDRAARREDSRPVTAPPGQSVTDGRTVTAGHGQKRALGAVAVVESSLRTAAVRCAGVALCVPIGRLGALR